MARLTTILTVWTLGLTLGLASLVSAQQNPAAPRKQMRALRMNNGAVHLDGRLDDPVWAKAEKVTDFLQKEPVENGVPWAEPKSP